jgi:hypothetical protein
MLPNSVYFSLWSKYRPVIVQLMLASEVSPQKYRFFDHEFKAANSKEKTYSFELSVFGGKALNNIKGSMAAQELLSVLNMSRKANELLAEFQFEFSLDRHFMFHVTRKEVTQ